MGEVVTLHTITTLDTAPESVLNGARDADLTDVFVIGTKRDGSLYAAASTSDVGELLVLVEKFKRVVI